MKVLRKQIIEVNTFEVDDQLTIQLEGFGEFTATAQLVSDEGTLFMFDDYVTSRPMNSRNTKHGGYSASDLSKWISEVLLPAFPEDIRSKVHNLTIPTYGQMFGHDEWYHDVMELDDDEQLPLMKRSASRVASLNNGYEWGWLQNAVKENVSASNFAYVGSTGYANYDGASASGGVRPCFLIKA